MNLTNSCDVTARAPADVDTATGVPVLGTITVLASQACAFAVLNAAQTVQAWGDTTPTSTATVTAHLILPNYAATLSAPLDRYTVTVNGCPGTWRIEAARPGAQWTTYLLAQP